MKKAGFLVYLCLFASFAYAQSDADSVCNSRMENIFKVARLKVQYEMVEFVYREKAQAIGIGDFFFNDYFEFIRDSLLKQSDSTGAGPEKPQEFEWIKAEQLSAKEKIDYLKRLNYTPEKVLNEYKDFIRGIKLEKEIYLKCIEKTVAKGDASEYAKDFIHYSFHEPLSSIILPTTTITKLNFLNLFKAFVLENNEEILPDRSRTYTYLFSSHKPKLKNRE